MITWIPDNQTNGIGWQSACGGYAVRQCAYSDGRAADYWPYYRPAQDAKFMPLHPSLNAADSFADSYPTREGAVAACDTLFMRGEAWRHDCEVRDIIGKGITSPSKLTAHCAEVEKRRGRDAAGKLYKAVVARLR